MARLDDSTLSGPVRTCVGCRRRAARSELLRVTAGLVDGRPVVVPDPVGTAPGRGAHLHPTTECYDLAVRRRAFGRALRCEGGLSAAAVETYLDSIHPMDTTRNWSNSS